MAFTYTESNNTTNAISGYLKYSPSSKETFEDL